MPGAIDSGPIRYDAFILLREIGMWEGRPCVDIIPVGEVVNMRLCLGMIERALGDLVQPIEGSFDPSDPVVRLAAIGPANRWEAAKGLGGLRVYGVGNALVILERLHADRDVEWRYAIAKHHPAATSEGRGRW